MARALLLAPFWHDAAHVGRRRLAGMKRWLEDAGHEVLVVAAGERGEPGALDVSDPLARAGDVRAGVRAGPFMKLRRLFHEARHVPDDGIAWARQVAADDRVADAASGAAFILSSSPPESTHLAAHELSRAHDIPHVCDLQDGWIDEPLRPILQRFALRRSIEGRLEQRVLLHARCVLVTSEIWRERLLSRYPALDARTHTLPLGLGDPAEVELPTNRKPARPPMLLHAGSFTLSHNARRMELLLNALLAAPPRGWAGLRVQLLGALHPLESESLGGWQERFARLDCELDAKDAVPRQQFLEELGRCSGTLLLSASVGAIPSKLYEYLEIGRPVLAVCPRDSAVARLAERLPALHFLEMGRPEHAGPVVSAFLAAVREGREYEPPSEFSDATLRRSFLDQVEPLLESA